MTFALKNITKLFYFVCGVFPSRFLIPNDGASLGGSGNHATFIIPKCPLRLENGLVQKSSLFCPDKIVLIVNNLLAHPSNPDVTRPKLNFI